MDFFKSVEYRRRKGRNLEGIINKLYLWFDRRQYPQIVSINLLEQAEDVVVEIQEFD